MKTIINSPDVICYSIPASGKRNEKYNLFNFFKGVNNYVSTVILLVCFSSFSWGQTTVTLGGLTTGTCPFNTTATWTTPPAGLTFSNISRGVGVSCVSASSAIAGSGFNSTLANNISNSKWYTFSITSNSSTIFTLNSLSIQALISNVTGSPSYSIQYSIDAGAKTVIGSFTPTVSSVAYTIAPGSAISVPVSSVLNIFIIPNNLTASGTVARLINASSVSVTATLPPCSGTPVPGNTLASSTTVLSGGTSVLSLQNATAGSGVSYQWMSCATAGGTYTNVVGGTGATTASYTTAALTAATYFKCAVTCSGVTGTSTAQLVNIFSTINVPTSSISPNSVTCGVSTMIYDEGGGTGNYSTINANGYTILNNSGTGVITLSGTYDLESGNDKLNIYTGSVATGTPYATYTGLSGTITPITTSAGQALTIQVTTDVSLSYGGIALSAIYSGACAVCSGTPVPGNTISSATAVGSGGTSNLSIQNLISGNGVTYQWQKSTDGTTYSDVVGATSTTCTTAAITVNTYFRCAVTCSGSGLTGTSTAQLIQVLSTKNVPTSIVSPNSVTCGVSTMIYDEGGTGNYSTINANGYTILNNSGTGVITLSGTYDLESGNDKLNIYTGSVATGTPLVTYTGNSGTITSITTSAGQALTIQITTDGSVSYGGIALSAIYSGVCADCSGTPAPGNTIASSTTINSGSTTNLSLQNLISGNGVSYQWQKSTDGTTYSDIVGAISTTYVATLSVATYYKCAVTCSGSGLSGTSTAQLVNIFSTINVPTSSASPNSVTCGVSTLIYDQGGVAGNYSTINATGYTVLNNSGTGVITLTGTYDLESGNDKLKIFSGSVATGTPLVTYTGLSGTITPITTAAGQALTIQITTDGSLSYGGIALTALYSGTCAGSSPTLTLANATTAVAASNICASSTAVPIHAFNITGSNGGGALTNFGFTTTGTYVAADITNFKLLYCASNTFSSATQVTGTTLTTTLGATSHSFTAFTQAIGNATGYFWITMDVASGATNAGTITVSASASTDMTTTVTKAGSAIASATQTLKATPTVFYSASAGDLNSVSNWGSNTDGTGCNPSNFTTAGITYVIQNNAAATTSSSGWTVSGAGSIVKVGNASSTITFLAGGNLSFDCDLQITANATLNLNNKNMTLSGDFVRSAASAVFNAGGTSSTVTFSGAAQNVNVTVVDGTTPTDSDITFNHITISGTNVKLFYFKTNDRKLNINNFTVNIGALVTLYSNPQ